ncbi:hypothetical protein [Salinicola sp. DM10]|uniref:hypothetical protein n=1 Tax=Salinicola sp. DM10 TaxID=2815721 RepID=UPI001A8CB243|nr:hypothetical protein [Salinicola sp. DM10]MCE3025728.1 hypothetical protein [Salinicola sp. DM10]
MTTAVLLNNVAINASRRYTHGEGVPVAARATAVGSATRVVRAIGRASADASAQGDCRLVAGMSGVAMATCLAQPADGWRISSAGTHPIAASATAGGSAVRLVPAKGMAVARAGSAAVSTRYARLRGDSIPAGDGALNGAMLNGAPSYDTRAVATAGINLEPQVLATRLIEPSALAIIGTATLTPLAYDLTRWMRARPMRALGLSFADEARIRRLHVHQVSAGGSAIARAFTRAVPNAILGYGFTRAYAIGSIDPSAIIVARASRPDRAIGQAVSGINATTHHDTGGMAVGRAESFGVCDVIRDDVRYAYAVGSARARAVASGGAVRWAVAVPITRPTYTECRIDGVLIARDFGGRAVATAVATGALGTTTHWVAARMSFPAAARVSAFEPTVMRRFESVAEALAVSAGNGIRWTAQLASGSASAVAKMVPAIARVITDGRGAAAATADAAARPVRYAYARGSSISVGGVTLRAEINVARWMVGADATADAQSIGAPRQEHSAVATPVDAGAMATGDAAIVTVRATPQHALSQADIRPLVPRNVVIRAEGHASADAVTTAAARRLHYVDTWALQQVGEGPLGSMMLNGGGLSWRGASVATTRVVIDRTTFKINAARAANSRRTLRLTADQRLLTVPYTSREYRVA